MTTKTCNFAYYFNFFLIFPFLQAYFNFRVKIIHSLNVNFRTLMRNQITTLMPGAFKGYESLYQMYVPYLEALGGGGGGGLWL